MEKFNTLFNFVRPPEEHFIALDISGDVKPFMFLSSINVISDVSPKIPYGE